MAKHKFTQFNVDEPNSKNARTVLIDGEDVGPIEDCGTFRLIHLRAGGSIRVTETIDELEKAAAKK